MILGIGIDFSSVARIKKIITKDEKKFSEKIFSDQEISDSKIKKINEENLTNRSMFFAKRYAAKEAFAKALGTGIGRGVNFHDIEIRNNNLGKPEIFIRNKKESFINKHFGCKKFCIHLSLTDEKSIAGAVVIIEKIL